MVEKVDIGPGKVIEVIWWIYGDGPMSRGRATAPSVLA